MAGLRNCVRLISMLALFLISHARSLINPNMEGNKKTQSLSMSPLSALVKAVPVDLPSPPSPWNNNHDDQSVQGEVVPLDKSFVPPSAPSPCTVGDANGFGNHDEMSGGECPVGA